MIKHTRNNINITQHQMVVFFLDIIKTTSTYLWLVIKIIIIWQLGR